jgi:glycosyltransferase involved in cell wall biosynthesis
MMSAKRPILLLRAFERVVARVPEAALIMVGRGPLREAVEKNIRERKLDDKVRLIPVATPGFVIGLLSRVQVFVLPSQSEGLSNALLEAMAAGKAIVASDNESHRAMFRNGDNALLFRLDDHEDLAEKITLILTDRRLRSRLSRSARELCVQRFSTTQLGPKLENLYLATVQSASPHNRYKALSFQRSTTVARNS